MLITQYLVSFGTQPTVAVPRTGLFPAVNPRARLGVRAHTFHPGPAQTAGCKAGRTASDGCMATLLGEKKKKKRTVHRWCSQPPLAPTST